MQKSNTIGIDNIKGCYKHTVQYQYPKQENKSGKEQLYRSHYSDEYDGTEHQSKAVPWGPQVSHQIQRLLPTAP
jgi:hypothetical protein